MKWISLFTKYVPFYFVIFIWLVKLVETILNKSFVFLGNHPRHVNEWYTMLTGALIHSDWEHLANNTYPLIVCSIFIAITFRKSSNILFLFSYFLTGLLIFLFARTHTYHIGASGVAYCWAALLITLGILRKQIQSIGIGLIIVFLYSSMIWGVLPIQPGISWDGHLLGAISGVICAILFQNIEKPKQKVLSDGYDFEKFSYGEYEYIKRKKQVE